jgi:hypothetical protein
MDSNSTVVYINDEQFSKLLESINSKDVQSEVAQDTQNSSVSDTSDSSLTEIDVLSYILLAQFIIIGILSWAMVRRK